MNASALAAGKSVNEDPVAGIAEKSMTTFALLSAVAVVVTVAGSASTPVASPLR